MPTPLPIPQGVIEGIEDVIDQSRLAGFDHGHRIGYEEGFMAAIKAIEGQLTLISIPSKPAPIVEAYGFEIIETDAVVPKPRKKRIVSVKALGLSTKTQNALSNAGITKIKQLTEMSAADLRKLPRIGAGAVKEIASVLKKHGRSLKA